MAPPEKYLIQFSFTDGVVYAGMFKGALGFAASTETALRFVSVEVAQRNLENGYGTDVSSVASIVTLEEAERAAAA